MKFFNKNIFKEGGRNPHVDWAVILIIFVIISLVFIINNAFLYNRVVSGDIQNPNQENVGRKRTFNQKEADVVLNDFAKKADVVSKLKKGYTTYPDPSKP